MPGITRFSLRKPVRQTQGEHQFNEVPFRHSSISRNKGLSVLRVHRTWRCAHAAPGHLTTDVGDHAPPDDLRVFADALVQEVVLARARVAPRDRWICRILLVRALTACRFHGRKAPSRSGALPHRASDAFASHLTPYSAAGTSSGLVAGSSVPQTSTALLPSLPPASGTASALWRLALHAKAAC